MEFSLHLVEFNFLVCLSLRESSVGRAQGACFMAVEAEVLLPGATSQKRLRFAPPAPESSRQEEANDEAVDVTVGKEPPSCNHSVIFLVILLLNPCWHPRLPSFYGFLSTFVSPFFLSEPSVFIRLPSLPPPAYALLPLGPSYLPIGFPPLSVISPLHSLLFNVLPTSLGSFISLPPYKSLPHYILDSQEFCTHHSLIPLA